MNLLSSFSALILLGGIIALNILKLGYDLLKVSSVFPWKSKSSQIQHSVKRRMQFLEWIQFFVCFLPSMILMMLTLYLHNQNQVQCPRTFFKYQLSFCECDLIEREFHKEQRTPEWELNELCNTRYATESVLYLDTNILFSVNLPSNNYEGNTGIEIIVSLVLVNH